MNNHNDSDGQYWWVPLLFGFLIVVGLLMVETAMLAVLP